MEPNPETGTLLKGKLVGHAPPWARLLLYMALALVLRGPFAALPVMNIDEAVWMTGARIWHLGGTPYLDFVDTKPPVIFAFYRCMLFMTGAQSEWALPLLRFASILMLALAALAMDRTAAQLLDRKRGSLLAGALLITGLSLGVERQTQFVSTELVCALLFAAGLWLASKESPFPAFLAGILSMLLPFTRIPAAVLVLPVAALVLLIRPQRLLRIAGYATGLLAGAALVALWVPGDKAFSEMVFWSYTANTLYVNVGPGAEESLARFVKNIGAPFALTLPVWICVFAGIRNLEGRRRLMMWSAFATAILSFAAAAAGGRWLAHYYLQVIPPLALAAGLAADRHRRLKPAAAIVALAGASVFTVAGVWRVWVAQSTSETLPAIADASDFIYQSTQETDRLLVWGYGSDLYERSGRLPATRQLTPATTVTGYTFGGVKELAARINPRSLIYQDRWAQFMDDLRCTPPALIVDFSKHDFHYFGDFDLSNYLELYYWVRTNCRTVAGPASTADKFEFLVCHGAPDPGRCHKP